MRLVSKQFSSVYDSSTQLQYLVALGCCGLVPNAAQRIQLTSSDAMNTLFVWYESWRNLYWHAVDSIDLDGAVTFCDMVDGVFALGRGSSARIAAKEFDVIDVLDTRSEDRVIPSWTLEQDITFVHMAFDPAQDLLVGIQHDITASPLTSVNDAVYKTHVLSFSSGLPHPSAAQHSLPLSDYRMRRAEGFRLEILDEYLAIHVCADPSSLLPDRYIILNWRTGIVQLQYSATRDSFSAFHLLIPGMFLKASRERTSNTGPHESFLSLHTFELQTTSSRNPPYHGQMLAKFMLPSLAPGATLTTRFVFFPRNSTSQRSGTAPFATLPFTPARGPEAYVLVLGMTITRNRSQREFFTLIFCPGSLLRIAALAKTIAPEFSWDVWGPTHTRLVRDVLGGPTTFGYAGPWPGPGTPRWVMGYRVLAHRNQRVWDFNPYPLARNPGDTEGVVSAPSVLISDGLFARKVETRLPYRESRPRRPWAYQAMFLDDHIVGLKMSMPLGIPRRYEIESLDVLLMMPEATHLLPSLDAGSEEADNMDDALNP